jgi:hypothetical protein
MNACLIDAARPRCDTEGRIRMQMQTQSAAEESRESMTAPAYMGPEESCMYGIDRKAVQTEYLFNA